MGTCESSKRNREQQVVVNPLASSKEQIGIEKEIYELRKADTKSDVVSQIIKCAPKLEENDKREQVELFFSLFRENLKQNSTYQIRLGLLTKNAKIEQLLGSTNEKHIEEDSENIDFDKTFVIDYFFESKQVLYIYFVENGKKEGYLETTVADVMGAKNSFKIFDMKIGGKTISMIIQGNPVKYNDYNLSLDLSVDFGAIAGKPYYVVKRNLCTDYELNWIRAYKSEVLLTYPKKNKFKVVNLSTQFLCNSDMKNKPIIIEFYDSTENKLIGQVTTTIEKLIQMQTINLSPLTASNRRSSIKNGIVDHGQENLEKNKTDKSSENMQSLKQEPKEVTFNCSYKRHYKFLDYVRGGVIISMIVGIDFTSSNGDPNSENSLHSIVMNPNYYEQAVRTCCNIVSPYDENQLFPVFGFGAQIDNDNSNAFNLNKKKDPNVKTVQGILDCYRNFLPEARLGGPTFFSPLISKCNMIAKNIKMHNNSDVYSVLIILTDGLICDMDDTIDDLVEASTLPISIIIIGIGPGDPKTGFQGMVILDSDDKNLISSRGEKASRDIVQFVQFNLFANDLVKLAEHVLEEVPRQVESYYNMIGKVPEKDN